MPRRRLFLLLLAAYALLMLWLMFLQRAPSPERSCNLIPGRTLIQLWSLLGGRAELRRFAVTNLFGNVVMFLPLGLLPAIWPRLRRFGWFLFTVTVLILVLEGVQYLTRLGSADVDDLILNLIGAGLGFAIWKFCIKMQDRRT